jgi:hypothetical protein
MLVIVLRVRNEIFDVHDISEVGYFLLHVIRYNYTETHIGLYFTTDVVSTFVTALGWNLESLHINFSSN